jgi:hypothetical protein
VAESDLSPAQLTRVYLAELGLQAAYNATEPYTDWLAMALLRRCARAAAAKGLPLGTLPAQMTGWPDAYGVPATGVSGGVIPRLDAEIERYEAPTRVIAFALWPGARPFTWWPRACRVRLSSPKSARRLASSATTPPRSPR